MTNFSLDKVGTGINLASFLFQKEYNVMKTFLKVAALCLPLFFAAPNFAQVRFGIDLHFGDPAYRPYPDAVWVPGYYYYEPSYGRRVWMEGRWRHHDEGRHLGWYKEHEEGRGHGRGRER